MRADNEVAGKPVPVVICHTECPVVAAGVLFCDRRLSACALTEPRPFFTLTRDISGKQPAEELTIRTVCDAGQPLQPVRSYCPCWDATPGLSATNLSL